MSYNPQGQQQGYAQTTQGYPQTQNPGYNYPPPQGIVQQASPQQYQQQQVYYQSGQPQGYAPGQPQIPYGQQPTVFVQPQPQLQPVRFENEPARCQCPHCHAIVDSKIEREIGTTTCIHCFFFSCVCCCCLPFFMDCSKDAAHFCPNCKKHLATYNQPAIQTGGGGGGGGFRRPSHGGPDAGEGAGPDGGDGGD